ncbi:MAG: cytochrome c biogenesis protein CcsA [Candidatus Thiodiazotropha sp. (ex. Lucinoma kazani)]
MSDYTLYLYPAATAFHLAGWLSIQELVDRHYDFSRWIGTSVLVGMLCVAMAIIGRWTAFGEGPFLTMHEVLLSSLFSLSLVFGVAYLFIPIVRIGAPFAVGIMLLLFFWATNTDSGFKPLPPTYQTPWLWAHVITGKLFLGSCLVATSLGICLVYPLNRFVCATRHRWTPQQIERQVWSWLTIAFLCHSAMLIAGAVWAQDAWGRFWDWDPLESWAFATWLCMAVVLHLRSTYRLGPLSVSLFALGTFFLAFMTFFGVPFISINPHQGAV